MVKLTICFNVFCIESRTLWGSRGFAKIEVATHFSDVDFWKWTWSLVWGLVPVLGPCPWSFFLGPWSQVLGPWSRFLVQGPWSLVPGLFSLVPGPCNSVPSSLWSRLLFLVGSARGGGGSNRGLLDPQDHPGASQEPPRVTQDRIKIPQE